MDISAGQREHLLELLTNMTNAKCESAYMEAYRSLKDTNIIASNTILWHPIRQEWVCYVKRDAFCLGEATNNRLESINGKIKSVCSKFATLSKFFDEFFCYFFCFKTGKVT